MRINDLATGHSTELDALIDGTMMLDSQGYGLNCDRKLVQCSTILFPLATHSNRCTIRNSWKMELFPLEQII